MKHPHWKYGETSVFVEDISISNGLFCKLLFPSLHQLVTKNQKPTTKLSCFDFCCRNSKKEKKRLATFLFLKCVGYKKKLNKFVIWFLLTS